MISLDSLIIALMAGLLGFIFNEFIKRKQAKAEFEEVAKAKENLSSKGYKITLDRLHGLDTETQREMELVRSRGYTVLSKNGKAIDVKI